MQLKVQKVLYQLKLATTKVFSDLEEIGHKTKL